MVIPYEKGLKLEKTVLFYHAEKEGNEGSVFEKQKNLLSSILIHREK
ncbi:MAG: hypothetical protein LBC20_09490 [Planctomycetaceae bacterium]|jgi:hypothetical protein|nr:hypothetical protein [Planctomycetaceae bacterium]